MRSGSSSAAVCEMTDSGDTVLDLVCLGRINLNLYAEQDGAPLEGVQFISIWHERKDTR